MKKMTLGQRIRLARKDRGLTSEKLSEACFIDAIYLRQIEAGMKIPSLQVFILLCQALQVSPSYLLIDTIESDDFLELEELGHLLKAAAPSQLHLVTSMVRCALDCISGVPGTSEPSKQEKQE